MRLRTDFRWRLRTESPLGSEPKPGLRPRGDSLRVSAVWYRWLLWSAGVKTEGMRAAGPAPRTSKDSWKPRACAPNPARLIFAMPGDCCLRWRYEGQCGYEALRNEAGQTYLVRKATFELKPSVCWSKSQTPWCQILWWHHPWIGAANTRGQQVVGHVVPQGSRIE